MQQPKKKTIIASVITHNNKILIAQRGKPDDLYGKWEFPGGKVEADETYQECLKRELREEFNIEAEIGDYLCTSYFTYKEQSMEMHAFYVPSYQGTIQLTEHQQIRWVSIEELSHYEFPEADMPIIKALIDKKTKT